MDAKLARKNVIDTGTKGNTVNGSETAGDVWLEATSMPASGRSSRGEQVRKENGQVLAHMIFDEDNLAAAKEDSDTTASP
jgi:hypothetical protein